MPDAGEPNDENVVVVKKPRTCLRSNVARDIAAARVRLPYEFTAAKKELVVQYLERGFTKTGAARLAGVSSLTTFYDHMKKDPAFAAAVDEAYRAGTEYLEDGARSRGLEGSAEPVIHQGALSYRRDPVTNELERGDDGLPVPLTVMRKSDNLLMFTLKSRDRQRYADFPGVMPSDPPGSAFDMTSVRDVLTERLRAVGQRMTVERVTERVTIEPKGDK